MGPNPVLRKLGLGARDRVVVIHADDLGMCQATVEGLDALFGAGIVTSGAVMVPCPWFRAAARWAAAHPQADLGVHITLTSEWGVYRWGPVSTADPASGLVDGEGCLKATAEAVQSSADPAAVDREIEAQIRRARENGMRPTHADTHMGAVAHARFLESYLRRSLEAGLPPMALRLDADGWRAVTRDHRGANLSEEAIARAVAMTAEMEERGVPLLDHIGGMSLSSDPARRLEDARAALDALEPGLTHFIIHPARDTPELRAIAPDWACRAADLDVFTRGELEEHARRIGLHRVGYGVLQSLMGKRG